MVKEPSDATTSILRQIQGTLADHGHRLDALEHLIQEVAGRLGEIRTGMMTVLGFVTHADNRHNELQRDIDDLKRRVGVLEEKV
jgi:hypothetical protein